MIFPFAGGSDDGNSPESFLLQEMNGFGLVVRFLIRYLMYNRGEKFFIFRGKRIPVTDNYIGGMPTQDIFIGSPVTANYKFCILQHLQGKRMAGIFAIGKYHGFGSIVFVFHCMLINFFHLK